MIMNINTDTNQTIDKLSGLNGEAQDTSVLNSLFSINFNSEEISSDNNIIDKEYLDKVVSIHSSCTYLHPLDLNFRLLQRDN